MNRNARRHPETLNWQGRGYFAYEAVDALPAPADCDKLSAQQPYPAWTSALTQARQGDFAPVSSLLQMANGDTHPVIQRLCEDLLGDAGPARTLDEIADRVSAPGLDYEQVMGWCGVLTRRGRLADIAVVLDAFERIVEIEDAEIIPVKISEYLEAGYELADHTGFDSFQHYRQAVLARRDDLASQFGSDQALVVHGQRLSMTTLAERIVNRAREPHFPTCLHRVFEASTGIDCSSFYEAGRFKPMQAAALMETFLESPLSRQFEDGVRYFFGHRIP